MNRKWRLYLDTSVFGGCFDFAQGWVEDSRRVIDAAVQGIAVVYYSDAVARELKDAPAHVREMWNSIPLFCREEVALTPDIKALSEAYISAGVVGKGSVDDTLHVAAATVARADAIVSWNFKHMVRLDRIKGYNQVNLSLGYGIITIVCPTEVRFDE